jgi:hypothetical protein
MNIHENNPKLFNAIILLNKHEHLTSTKDALIYGWPSIRLKQTRLRSSK